MARSGEAAGSGADAAREGPDGSRPAEPAGDAGAGDPYEEMWVDLGGEG
jgi:hypothetical protein